MRAFVLSTLLFLAGCRDGAVLGVDGELRVQPERLDFPSVWVGHPVTSVVTVANAGRRSLEVSLTTSAPFSIEPTLVLAGGAVENLTVTLHADTVGPVDGVLLVASEGRVFEVVLHGDVAQPPTCAASPCHVSTFDPVTGACVEVPGNEGAACGRDNACLIDGACRSGACVGTPRDCDDGNLCTSDSCGASRGCRHDDVTCAASTDPCRAALCDPTTGCTTAPVEDGVACGANDCTTAHVCIGGACVTRPAPDGSRCAEGSGCIGPSTCVNATCTAPAPTVQLPAWSYGPLPERDLAFLGHVDNDGNVYLVESYFMSDSGEVDTLVSELVSFSPTGRERFRVALATACTSCRYGVEFALDTAGGRLFHVLRSELVARSLSDGRELWRVPYAAGVPVYDGRPDGGGAYSPSAPMLVGTDGVAVPMLEGLNDHHAYVRVFDRATGALRWQFHRKGHLYGPGVTGDGELWVSSANCWAVAGEMARVASDGTVQRSWFHEWIPQVYGEDVAFGSDSQTGRPSSLDPALTKRDLSTVLGTSRVTPASLVLDSRFIFFTAGVGVSSVDLDGGARFDVPETRTIRALQVLRSGGVGWTGAAVDGGYIHAVDGQGAPLYACPTTKAVDGAAAFVRGRLYAGSGGALVVYETPGLDASPRGWSGPRGSPERSGRAR